MRRVAHHKAGQVLAAAPETAFYTLFCHAAALMFVLALEDPCQRYVAHVMRMETAAHQGSLFACGCLTKARSTRHLRCEALGGMLNAHATQADDTSFIKPTTTN